VIIDNHYTYDNVDNLLRIENEAPVPPSNLMGGKSDHQYSYDDLYRLTNATGIFSGSTHEHRYTLTMSYDKLSSILGKNQVHERRSNGSGNWVTQNQTTYNYNYNYNTNGKPHAALHIGDKAYTYDANGNQNGWKHDVSAQNRMMTWDEENRMKTLSDNGELFSYTYDAAGERVLKNSGGGNKVSVNGKPAAQSGGIGNYTVYVNPFMVVRSGGFTKHFYSDDGRIASKLGESGNGNANGGGSGKAGGNGNNQESFQFYFHADHVGNTAFVTDRQGEVYQHLEYFAFGETFIHEHSNQERTPYLYNGKEQDEETGLYYYGARYYDAITSSWQRVDPYWQLPNEINKSPYAYVLNNPILYSDPDGKSSHIKKGTIGIGGKHGQTKQASKKGEVESDHIPPFDAMKRGGIKRSRDQMGAVTVPRDFHRAVITTGSGKASKEFRDEQAELIADDRFAEAVELNLEDYGEKADQFKLTKKQREEIVEGLDDMFEFQVGQDWISEKEKSSLKKVARKQLKVGAKKKAKPKTP
ncbi:MAG: RHS repeat-associated core domain-containing protein, partial [Chitinophagaceae bacterium]